jgi:diadenosine tetraphosphatase ApaH/serine/threonine PP2A family protein phosphatase
MKIKYPTRIFLIRGKHESRNMTQTFGFYNEICGKYREPKVWLTFMDIFDLLPLAAIIDSKIFCVHSGLSPNLTKIDEINHFDRFIELPLEGPIGDLLWSEPQEKEGWGESQKGAGHVFGEDISKNFNYVNDILMLVRSNTMVMNVNIYIILGI